MAPRSPLLPGLAQASGPAGQVPGLAGAAGARWLQGAAGSARVVKSGGSGTLPTIPNPFWYLTLAQMGWNRAIYLLPVLLFTLFLLRVLSWQPWLME